VHYEVDLTSQRRLQRPLEVGEEVRSATPSRHARAEGEIETQMRVGDQENADEASRQFASPEMGLRSSVPSIGVGHSRSRPARGGILLAGFLVLCDTPRRRTRAEDRRVTSLLDRA
jgi:hypothetical protein